MLGRQGRKFVAGTIGDKAGKLWEHITDAAYGAGEIGRMGYAGAKGVANEFGGTASYFGSLAGAAMHASPGIKAAGSHLKNAGMHTMGASAKVFPYATLGAYKYGRDAMAGNWQTIGKNINSQIGKMGIDGGKGGVGWGMAKAMGRGVKAHPYLTALGVAGAGAQMAMGDDEFDHNPLTFKYNDPYGIQRGIKG